LNPPIRRIKKEDLRKLGERHIEKKKGQGEGEEPFLGRKKRFLKRSATQKKGKGGG